MTNPRSDTATIIVALRILADKIKMDDGISNVCILEAADRLEENLDVIYKLHIKIDNLSDEIDELS